MGFMEVSNTSCCKRKSDKSEDITSPAPSIGVNDIDKKQRGKQYDPDTQQRQIEKQVGIVRTPVQKDSLNRCEGIESRIKETDLEKINPLQVRKAVAEQTPLGRNGTAEDVARAILFLASNEAANFITGEYIAVNGGLLMRA